MVDYFHKVSKKGQVVIPAKYREDLGISSANVVNFRIRGNVLILEKFTNTVTNINFLKNKKGTLGEKYLTVAKLKEVITGLLFQQFYKGEDVISDRIGMISLNLDGLDKIMDKIIKSILNISGPWMKGDYLAFVLEFAELMELDFPSLLENVIEKLKSIEGIITPKDQDSALIYFSFALTEGLKAFRVLTGHIVTENLIKNTSLTVANMKNRKNVKVNEFDPEELEKKIIDEIAQNYSILLNLKVAEQLARISSKSIIRDHYLDFSQRMYESIFTVETSEEKKDEAEESDEMPEMPSFDL